MVPKWFHLKRKQRKQLSDNTGSQTNGIKSNGQVDTQIYLAFSMFELRFSFGLHLLGANYVNQITLQKTSYQLVKLIHFLPYVIPTL